MYDKILIKRIYTAYKFILFLITFIFFMHLKKGYTDIRNVVFFVYFLDATLFLIISNRYFVLLSMMFDIGFAYFLAKLLGVEELIMFSIAPLFLSCILLECFLAWILVFSSMLVVLLYSDVNVVFAIISYIAAFFSSYLLKESILQKKIIEKKLEFDKEFDEKITIAKRMSLEFAHEIRNPLMAVSGAIEIIKNTDNKKTIDEMIEIAQKEIDRANNLTRDFLNLENPYNANKSKMDVCQFLKDFALSRSSIVEIELKCLQPLLELEADKDMLTKMFDNLIRNSMEAKADKIIIEASLMKDYVVVKVQDNGIGIDMDKVDKEKIFMPFFTTKNEGSGLGLAICKQVASTHGGTINIIDEHTFRITLRRA
jgi:signal transduction histidine kinase